jgi:hypothetical protein
MGQQISAAMKRSLSEALSALAAGGIACQVLMVDGNLVMPTAPVPPSWREVRLRSPAGMVTLRRQGDQIAAVVFGNAAPALVAVSEKIVAAFGG